MKSKIFPGGIFCKIVPIFERGSEMDIGELESKRIYLLEYIESIEIGIYELSCKLDDLYSELNEVERDLAFAINVNY